MSNTVFRPYQSKLYPNSRKAPMVKNTFEWLHRAYGSFFDMIIALYGGLQHKDVSNLLSENDDRITDPDLICAINWFRVCPCSGNPSPVSDLQTRIDRFRQYAGHEPSHIAAAYLSAPIDVEKDEWVDCRQLYQQFCQTVGANLDVDLSTLVQSGLLPVVKDDSLNSYSFVSNLFGEGKKEDPNVKSAVYAAVATALSNQNPTTYEEYRQLLSQVVPVHPAGRGKDILNIDLNETKTGLLPNYFVENRRARYSKSAADKARGLALPNRLKIKSVILNMLSGGTYNTGAWSAPMLKAFSDIKSKNSNNYRYTLERDERRTEIANLAVVPNIRDAQQVLQQFRAGEFNEFVVEKRHISKALPSLYEMWEIMDMKEGIDNYIDALKSDKMERQPIREVLELIYPHRNTMSAELFLSAAELNKLEYQNNRRKVHPTVHGSLVVNFGKNSTIFGTITPPDKLIKFRGEMVPAGQTGMIWFTMQLLDEGKWVKHHIPCHSSRFFEEIYAWKQDLPSLPYPRRAVYGSAIGNKISDTSKIDSRRKKCSKQYLRTLENMTHNVDFDPTTQFMVDGDYNVTITSRVQKIPTNRELPVGSRIMGLNKNQTIRDCYSIWERVAPNTEGSYQHPSMPDVWLQFVADGHIGSVVNGNIDQMSYAGPDVANCANWIQERSAFVTSIDDDEQSFMKYFLWNNRTKLYAWNLNYSRLLTRTLRKRMTDANRDVFRKEIIAFICGRFGHRLGSLTQISLDLIRQMKSLILSYFNLNKAFTLEEQSNSDKELFDVLNLLENKRVNKRKEKVNRTISSILQICKTYNVTRLVVTKNSPTATQDVKSSVNQRVMDWCARKIEEKIVDQANAVGVYVDLVDSLDLSHIDPFVYVSGGETGKECQFDEVTSTSLLPIHTSMFKDWHGMINKGRTTTNLYNRGLREFASQYGLDFDQFGKIKSGELSALLPSGKVLIPHRGGRFFLSTHPVTSNAVRCVYAGRNRWLNSGDMVAPVNTMLRAFKRNRS